MNVPLHTEPIGNAAIVAMSALSHSPRCHAYEAELRHYGVDFKPDFGQCNRREMCSKFDLDKDTAAGQDVFGTSEPIATQPVMILRTE